MKKSIKPFYFLNNLVLGFVWNGGRPGVNSAKNIFIKKEITEVKKFTKMLLTFYPMRTVLSLQANAFNRSNYLITIVTIIL